jgi:hypothetical protein
MKNSLLFGTVFVLSFLFIFPSISEASPVFRTSATANQIYGNTATSGTLSGVQAGDLIIIALRERDGLTPVSISDSVNGTWNLLNVINNNGIFGHSSIYYFPNSIAGNPTVTITYSNGATFSFYVSSWGGIETSNVLYTSNTANNSSQTNHSHGSITTNGESLIITASSHGSTAEGLTGALGFTSFNTLDRNSYQYKISPSSETTSGSFTTSNTLNTSNTIASFRVLAGTVSPTPTPTPTPVPTPTPPPPTPTPPPPTPTPFL